MVPTLNGCNDFVGVGGPDERLRGQVVLMDVIPDGLLKIGDGREDATADAPTGDDGKEAFDGVEPGGGGGGEMEDPSRMICQPLPDLGVLVGGVIIGDGMDQLAGRDGSLDRVEELDEFLMGVLGHTAANDGAIEDVEGGEQRGRAVALVVVGHGAALAGLQRQAWLGAVESLDLGLFIDRHDDGVSWRAHIEADDIADLGGELRIVGQFEQAPAVRLKAMGAPDALDRTDADADDSGHGRSRPVGHFAWRIGGGGPRHHAFGDLIGKRRYPRWPGFVPQEAVHAIRHEALLPAPDSGLALASQAHDFDGAKAVGGQQHNPRSPDVLLGAVAIRHHRFQTAAVGGAHFDDNSFAHPPDSHIRQVEGIRRGTRLLDFDH
jgi:hypothetical protein